MRRPGTHFELAAVVLAAVLGTSSCSAQYRVSPGKFDQEMGCSPISPAHICLGASGTSNCYAPVSDKDYIFALEPKATTVGKLNGRPLILFSATFSGCGSGTLTDFSLLTTKAGRFVNLLPKVRLTNESEYKLWNLPEVSAQPIMVTADFIWDFKEDETHFAAHRYQIEGFVFDAKSDRYLKKLSYASTKKYPGLDEVDEIRVLPAEKSVITAKLRQALLK